MIVLSLVLVVAAAVSLLVGLFATESLALIFVAIGLCVASLALLFIGSRQRRQVPATSGGPVSYGAPPTAGAAAPSVTRPVSTPSSVADEGEDEGEGAVVRKTTARDAASKRVAAAGPVARVAEEAPEEAVAEEAPPAEAPASVEPEEAAAPAPKKVAKKVVKKSAKKAATKKTAAKKTGAKKTAAKKTAATTSARKATKKSTAKKTAKKTTGAAARAALDAVSGVGAAKQDALLKKFGSLEAIRAASEDEISQIEGFGPALAKRVKNELS